MTHFKIACFNANLSPVNPDDVPDIRVIDTDVSDVFGEITAFSVANRGLKLTEPHEEDGVISHGVWFYPEDFDPHLRPEMIGNSKRARKARERVARCTEAIVRSIVLTKRPDLTHHRDLDYHLELTRDAAFNRHLVEDYNTLSNRQVYMHLAAYTIVSLDEKGTA